MRGHCNAPVSALRPWSGSQRDIETWRHAKRNASLPFSEIVDQLFITLFHKTGAVTFVIESSWNTGNQLSRLMLIGML